MDHAFDRAYIPNIVELQNNQNISARQKFIKFYSTHSRINSKFHKAIMLKQTRQQNIDNKFFAKTIFANGQQIL